MPYQYDYVIVGTGLFGAIFAYEARKKSKKVLVLEKRDHIGGNIYCINKDGINIHQYGAHIFHTNNRYIWDYMNQFGEFNSFVNSPMANYKGELYNLPFNMNTFHKMWGSITPRQARDEIDRQRALAADNPANLEEQAISLVGRDIYDKLIKGYTEKQWGRDCRSLPEFIIKRIPIRYTYDNNYFNAKYQGIPVGGYNAIINNLLANCEVVMNEDFNFNRTFYNKIAHKIVFTGQLDAYFDYIYGALEYRSLKFKTKKLDIENYQGVAVMNYTDSETPYTRIIEHKHFEFGNQPITYITEEYPCAWSEGEEPYYPVNDAANNKLYERYAELALKENKVIFGGRLAEYKYYDMDQVIESSLRSVEQQI